MQNDKSCLIPVSGAFRIQVKQLIALAPPVSGRSGCVESSAVQYTRILTGGTLRFVFWQIPAVAVVNDAGVLTGYVSDDTAKLIGTECTAGVETWHGY